MSSHLMPVFNRLPLSFTHGKGVWLYDASGKAYLDSSSGLGVSSLGHAHPKIVKAMNEQAQKLLHVSNGVQINEQEALANELCQLSNMERAFFCNSGAEANEGALKLARMFACQKKISDPQVIVFERSYHGRTLATLSASGNTKIQAGFAPLIPGFIRAPFNDLAAVAQIAQTNQNIVAVLVEPILGNAGIIIPNDDFLPGLRQICDQHDWLLMLDEVQTGIGRTGPLFAFQHSQILPDVVCSAKALANGVPIGALLTRDKARDLFQLNNHGSTFGGGPFVSQIARTVLQTMVEERVMENTANVGNYLLKSLRETFQNAPFVKEIRGKGLMLGVQLNVNTEGLNRKSLEHGLLLNLTGENTIRLLPPLIMTPLEADELVARLQKTLAHLYL